MNFSNTYFKLLCLVALSCLFSCCGGGGGSDDHTPDTVIIDFFDVYGNDSTVNDRKQIVATINDGKFQIDLSIEPIYSHRATIFISDNPNIDNTIREQKIVDFECSYYPFCISSVPTLKL